MGSNVPVMNKSTNENKLLAILKIRPEPLQFITFTITVTVLDKFGGTEADIKRRLALARIAFTRLQNIWRSGRFSQKTKLRILNSNMVSVLLYGAEMWRVTTTDLNKLDVFHRTCLRRVLRRFWPNHLSNEELYEATGSTPVSALIRVRRWRWIGHILRTSPSNILRTALTWAPEGKGEARPAERNVEKNCGKRKKPAGMAFRGGLRSHRRRTGMDGAIVRLALRVLMGPMRISK